MKEFEIIKHFFANKQKTNTDIELGIGDDTAIVHAPQGYSLAITTDTLVENVHFNAALTPYDIGYKALAVNLSDLAAMGAEPAWFTLALTLPHADTSWLKEFSQGLFALANLYHCTLIGGDLTKGPLSITIQAIGLVPVQKALKRSGAKPDDLIYVTGTLGDAGCGLHCEPQKDRHVDEATHFLVQRLKHPTPRIEIGTLLRTVATSAIDISDGLAADLNHLLKASQVGADVIVDHIPLSQELLSVTNQQKALEFALTSGDDYELCFTIPSKDKHRLEILSKQFACPITCIGSIKKENGLTLLYQDGHPYHGKQQGFEHF